MHVRTRPWPVLFLAIAAPAAAQPVVQVPQDVATLQAAIAAVPDGGIIEMAAGTYPAPSGGFVISNLAKRFTIRAAQGAAVTLSGSGVRDILRFTNTSLATGRPVVFENLTFAAGLSTTNVIGGAATIVRADATFVSCAFQNNAANPSQTGGGAVWIDGARVFFHDTLWQGNTSRNYGGAMVVANGARVYVHDSRFLSNRTNLPGHQGNATGGAVHVADATLRVTNTRFEGNQAGYVGGALYAFGTWSDPLATPRVDLIVVNSTFVDNQALRDASVSFAAPAVGGAVHVEDQTTARFFNTRFQTNTARQGGAISSYRALLEIEGDTFLGNRSTGTSAGEGLGGALIALSVDNADSSTGNGAINRRSTEVTIRDSYFQGRFGGIGTTARQGGCIFAGGDLNAAFGLSGVTQNGTPASNRAILDLTNVAFADCDVQGAAGIGGFGGALLGSLVGLTASSAIVVDSDANDSGAGLTFTDASSSTLVSTTLARNTAGTSGGAFYSLGGTVNVDQSRLVHNALTTGNSGAAMATFPNVVFGQSFDVVGSVQDSVISSNTGPSTFALLEGDANNPPANRLQYVDNTMFPGDGMTYFNGIAGARDVAGLNALVVMRSGTTSTDKAPANDNTAPGAAPVTGALLAVPPKRLPEAAAGDPAGPTTPYLVYAWSGGAAMLNGDARTGNSGFEAATFSGLQTLSVGGTPFTATVSDGPAPALTLSANPMVVPTGGSTQLSWNTTGGTFLDVAIDQGVTLTPAASGMVSVDQNVTTTYRAFLVTEEGGAIATLTVLGDGIFANGFQ